MLCTAFVGCVQPVYGDKLVRINDSVEKKNLHTLKKCLLLSSDCVRQFA